jgi:hypothetical protein
MKRPIRKIALLLVSLFVLVPLAAYWLLDSWIESAGGRQMLEKNLSARSGMKVSLDGEFDLMFLPDIGVSGTKLVIGGPGDDDLFANSEKYEISVALKPLLDGQVRIDWIRLTGGEVYPDRYRGNSSGKSGDAGGAFQMPEIQELAIRDFTVIFAGSETRPIHLEALEVSGFAAQRKAPFRLVIENLATASGWLRWDAVQSRLDLGALQLERLGQQVNGRGCLITGETVSLNLFLSAERIDLDALSQDLPDSGLGGEPGSESLPLEVRVQLSVEELKTNGAVARGVALSLGGGMPQQIVCGSE